MTENPNWKHISEGGRSYDVYVFTGIKYPVANDPEDYVNLAIEAGLEPTAIMVNGKSRSIYYHLDKRHERGKGEMPRTHPESWWHEIFDILVKMGRVQHCAE